eukprot:3393209-Rhodomonas_salina.1
MPGVDIEHDALHRTELVLSPELPPRNKAAICWVVPAWRRASAPFFQAWRPHAPGPPDLALDHGAHHRHGPGRKVEPHA